MLIIQLKLKITKQTIRKITQRIQQDYKIDLEERNPKKGNRILNKLKTFFIIKFCKLTLITNCLIIE
ncbi:unnamed protein product [Paramecium sonneborni]|uniref:Uncharacterized protein n=1 Tax=Paramecium sonneborni TaxID=65129 RepID=A0A8S1JUB9_9CILI|nr:unnamed protein product [Paramecium sonneborni]